MSLVSARRRSSSDLWGDLKILVQKHTLKVLWGKLVLICCATLSDKPCLCFRYSLPFDRHDWIVDSNGTETRYVIDFYKGSTTKAIQDQVAKAGQGNKQPLPVIAMHLDVRPAVDSPATALLRLRVFFWRMMGVNPFRSGADSKKPTP